MNDEFWMNLALEQAQISLKYDEVPVGSVIVSQDNRLISSGHNLMINSNDPSLHAEIMAIRSACKINGNYRLINHTLYTTLEPCVMCFGVIVHARIKKIVFGAKDERSGVCGSCLDLTKKQCFNHKPEIRQGIMEAECSKIVKDFFKAKRS